MREILFRAWDGKRYSIGNPEYFDDSVNFRFHHFDIDCEKPILEQFTGLHDATKWEDLTDAERDEWIKSGNTKEDWKGRRIFEGDIVKSITHFYSKLKEKVTVVKFNEVENDSFGEPFTVGYSLLGSEWEIIGNIHEGEQPCTSAIVE